MEYSWYPILLKDKMCIRDRMEDIDTMKMNDSALSIFLAMAQEESSAKSENIKFGIRARMRSGKTILNHSQFFGLHQRSRWGANSCS